MTKIKHLSKLGNVELKPCTDASELDFPNIKYSIENYGAYYFGEITFSVQSDYTAYAFFPASMTFKEVFHNMLYDVIGNINRAKARSLLKNVQTNKDGSRSLTVNNGDGTETTFTLRMVVCQNQESKSNDDEKQN